MKILIPTSEIKSTNFCDGCCLPIASTFIAVVCTRTTTFHFAHQFHPLHSDNSNHSESLSLASEQSNRFLEQRFLEQTDSKPSRSDNRDSGESLSVQLRADIRNYQTLCQDNHSNKVKQVQRHLRAAQRYLESNEFGACDFELRAIRRVLGF